MRLALALSLLCAACAGDGTAASSDSAALYGGSLTSPYLLASHPLGFEFDGVSGDERLLFATITNPVPGRSQGVVVARRGSGQFFAELPPPPGGWHFPAYTEVEDYETSGLGSSGTVLVIDNTALPPNSHMVLYRYSYDYHPLFGGFSAALLSTHELPQQPLPPTGPLVGVVYAGGLTVMPDGGVVITDSFFGALWACSHTLDDCRLAMIDSDWGFGPAPAFSGVGRAQGGGTRPYDLTINVGIMPGLLGVTYAAASDEVCTVRAAQPGGVYCVDRGTLLAPTDPTTKPKRALVPPTPGVSDLCHGIKADKYHPSSPWVYWIRSVADTIGGGSNVLRRVSVSTGEVQKVAQSLSLIDFGTGIAALPPLINGSPFTTIAVASGQEENNASINSEISTDQYVTPSLIAGIKISSQ